MLGQYITNNNAYTILKDWTGTYNAYYLTDSSTTPTSLGAISGSSHIIYDGVQFGITTDPSGGAFYMSVEDSPGLWKWTPAGGSASVASTPAGMRSLVGFKQRLWGHVRSELYYSESTLPESWPPENVIIVNGGMDGEYITAIVPFGDRLIIFKAGSMWALYLADEPTSWTLRCINPTIGCMGPNAVIVVQNLMYFTDRLGMYVSDGNTVQRLSTLFPSIFSQTKGITTDPFADHVSIMGEHVYFFIKGYGYFAYRYTEPRGFTRIVFSVDDSDPSQTAPNLPFTGFREQKLYSTTCRFLISVGHKLWSVDPTGTESIVAKLKTKSYDFSYMERMKRIKDAAVILSAIDNSLNVQYRWDGDGVFRPTSLTTVTDLVNLGTRPRAFKIPGSEFARTHSLEMQEISAKALTIYGANWVSQLHDEIAGTK